MFGLKRIFSNTSSTKANFINPNFFTTKAVHQPFLAGAWKGAIWSWWYLKSLQNRELRSYPQVSKHILDFLGRNNAGQRVQKPVQLIDPPRFDSRALRAPRHRRCGRRGREKSQENWEVFFGWKKTCMEQIDHLKKYMDTENYGMERIYIYIYWDASFS